MLTLETLFDEEFYLSEYPDVVQALENREYNTAFEHFFTVGIFQGYEPNSLFNSSYYRSRNTDVAAQIDEGGLTAVDHFVEYGQFELRSPNPLFDPFYYLEQNADVTAAFLRREINPFEHFFFYGQYEGRNPSPFFDTNYYLAQNPDVLSQIEDNEYNSFFEHYLRVGLTEGRLGTPPEFKDDLTQAINADILLGDRVIVGDVTTDNPIDIYQFIIPNNISQFSLSLSQLRADVDVELIQDLNGNQAIETNEIFASSANFGLTPELIEFAQIPGGTYFARVSQFEGNTNTNYVLTLSSTPL